MSNSIYILHLSDLHIKSQDPSESKPVYTDLCDKITEFKDQRRIKFSLLIISGDIVHKSVGNYQPAEERIDELLTASGLLREQVFMVPGNHDVERGKCSGFNYEGVVSELKRNPKSAFKKLDLDEDAKKELIPGFESFLKFSDKFPLHTNHKLEFPGFVQADIKVSGVPVTLCGLNTALVAGPKDQGVGDGHLKNRVVGRQLLWRMLDNKGRLNIVVSHYPLSWVHVSERREITQRLQKSNVLFFHGHTHEPATDIMGVTKNHKLLVLGVGSLFGEKWQGRNHCQVLELSSNNPSPMLHEWFWSGEYGWRGFEPLELQWNGWEQFSKLLGPSTLFSDHEFGLVTIGKGRSNDKRIVYYQTAFDLAAEGTDLLILGRSLIDYSLLYKLIERAINEKKLHVKIGIIDENTLQNKKTIPNNCDNCSWIEKPIPSDWAINDVLSSMERFRKIKVNSGTGSLEIYGLPFYLTHSFLSYTNKHDSVEYCLEEAGMALDKDRRPFIELKVISNDSYASSLVWIYRSMLTPERLLLFDNGQRSERDTTQRAKIIVPKAEKLGLVDLSVGRGGIDWFDCNVAQRILDTPDGGEIFIIGRSLVIWANCYRELAEAIINRRVNCIFAIADPTFPHLKSLVLDDYAENDLLACWKHFKDELFPLLEKHKNGQTGIFKLYGIPAYIPETFACYTGSSNIRFCTLEAGIGVGPSERAIFYFKQISDKDIYTSLNNIYRGIIVGRNPLLSFPTN